MTFARWSAWLGIFTAPVAAWPCGSVAVSAAHQSRSELTVDGTVVLAVSAGGAILAAYLTVLTAVKVASAFLLRRNNPPAALRGVPRAWGRVVTVALGTGLVAGASIPAFAGDDTDASHLGWLATPVAADAEASSIPQSALRQGPTPTLLAAPATVAATVNSSAPTADTVVAGHGGTYVVQRGDSLWHITRQLLGDGATTEQIAKAWPGLYEANRAVIGGNPSLIFSGQVLHIPASIA